MSRFVVEVRSPEEAVELQQIAEKRLLAQIHQAQLDSAHHMLSVLVADANAEHLVDTGLYKNSFEVIDNREEVRLENGAPYAGVVEQGARPFTPPLEPLIAWAERKAADIGIVTQAGNPGQFREGRYRGRASLTDNSRQAAKKIARAIQKKFQREGYRPRYVMKKRLPTALKFLRAALNEYLDKIASNPRG